MRVVFMGTPDFAVPSLVSLARSHDVSLVVTRPDAVRSRGHELEPSAVKRCALDLGLDVLETSHMDEGAISQVYAAAPDVICVAAYGCMLPDTVLGLAPLGCVNVHASLLPRWRGAAPIQRAILAGDERIGISIMRLVSKMDAGAYCRQASVAAAGKGDEELTSELARLGATELVSALDQMAAGTATWIEQDEGQVTFAPKVSKAEMLLDPVDDADVNLRRVLASSAAAPSRCIVGGKGVRVLRARLADDVSVPSGAVGLDAGRLLLGCSSGTLECMGVKPDGKREMDAAAWVAGARIVEDVWGRV